MKIYHVIDPEGVFLNGKPAELGATVEEGRNASVAQIRVWLRFRQIAEVEPEVAKKIPLQSSGAVAPAPVGAAAPVIVESVSPTGASLPNTAPGVVQLAPDPLLTESKAVQDLKGPLENDVVALADAASAATKIAPSTAKRK